MQLLLNKSGVCFLTGFLVSRTQALRPQHRYFLFQIFRIYCLCAISLSVSWLYCVMNITLSVAHEVAFDFFISTILCYSPVLSSRCYNRVCLTCICFNDTSIKFCTPTCHFVISPIKYAINRLSTIFSLHVCREHAALATCIMSSPITLETVTWSISRHKSVSAVLFPPMRNYLVKRAFLHLLFQLFDTCCVTYFKRFKFTSFHFDTKYRRHPGRTMTVRFLIQVQPPHQPYTVPRLFTCSIFGVYVFTALLIFISRKSMFHRTQHLAIYSGNAIFMTKRQNSALTIVRNSAFSAYHCISTILRSSIVSDGKHKPFCYVRSYCNARI